VPVTRPGLAVGIVSGAPLAVGWCKDTDEGIFVFGCGSPTITGVQTGTRTQLEHADGVP